MFWHRCMMPLAHTTSAITHRVSVMKRPPASSPTIPDAYLLNAVLSESDVPPWTCIAASLSANAAATAPAPGVPLAGGEEKLEVVSAGVSVGGVSAKSLSTKTASMMP